MKRDRNQTRMLHRIVERLRKEYHPTQIILFGSYAYGQPTRDSDLDLLIIKETTQPFYQRMFEVRKLVSPIRRGYAVEPIVVTPQELHQRLAKGDQFFQEIVTKGKQVYASRG